MLITPAYAQAAAGGGDASSMMVQLAPLALIFVVFYFFLIRPQQQKAKQQRSMLDAIRRGDRIVTAGGLIGTVAKVVNNEEVLVDLADNVRVRAVRSTISQVLAKTEPAKTAKTGDSDTPANDDSATATTPPAKDADDKTPAWRRMLGLR
ncbi:MAG TPA: preprotein translocase subunit YajC [Stellaceae bacterium]|jgi:preprotein translocase subunit YajC|nr:preprotein translocase subunit YajC [Stellaceae bacterium]